MKEAIPGPLFSMPQRSQESVSTSVELWSHGRVASSLLPEGPGVSEFSRNFFTPSDLTVAPFSFDQFDMPQDHSVVPQQRL